MKIKDLKIKPFQMGCCKNDCENYQKDMRNCVQPLCIDLAIQNDLANVGD